MPFFLSEKFQDEINTLQIRLQNKEKVRMNKRRIISIVAILGILAAVSVFAVQYISDVAKNTVKASNVKIKVVMLEDKGSGEVPVEDETTIVPGGEVSRIAKVKNTGDQTVWVRVKPALVLSDGSIDSSLITLNGIDTASWTEQGDYWYYNKALEPGETSDALFTSVTISDSIDASFDGANLKVDAEGTQVKNNGSTALEAEGWTN